MDKTRTYQLTVSAVFLAGIFVPLLGMWSSNDGNSEQRTLAPFPSLTLSKAGIEQYPGEFERYINDHFGFRNTLLDLQARIAYSVFGRSGSTSVIAGKKDWLFYADDQSLQDIQRIDAFSPAQVRTWGSSVQERGDWLAAKHIQYRLFVAPDKHTVYPEMLPKHLLGNGESRFEALSHTLAQSPYVVSPFQQLLTQKSASNGPLYFHTDTHWNSYGAYIGYRALMHSLGGQYDADAMKLDLASFATQSEPRPTDLSKMIRMPRTEANVASDTSRQLACLRQTQALPPMGVDVSHLQGFSATTCEGKPGTALVFHDSFMGAMTPYLSGQFGRVVYVWSRPSAELFIKMVEQEKPDVVIEERVERYMRTPPETDIRETAARLDKPAGRQFTSADELVHEVSNSLLGTNASLQDRDGELRLVAGNKTWIVPHDPDGSGGFVDEVRVVDGKYHFSGWAGLPLKKAPAQFVVVTAGNAVVYVAPVSGPRADVAAYYDLNALKNSGFTFDVPHDLFWTTSGQIRVFAINADEIASVLVKGGMLQDVQQRNKTVAVAGK
ncbi:alginate O-acetyltransferase AlgX-related protein [Caballeronia insecticola]|uniref:AlgX/AlgJ SGNH hydrolase-like domain-containing protein n=1 Tax=Caballeronia insecticola TaxID=758793 RepID=R4WXU5_9BURK|nr:hypothetical protein [Caballeronia insecticola]BAN23941.1 hypothetical protein BRPE64_ACDS21870 [Caballeronia insecticola]